MCDYEGLCDGSDELLPELTDGATDVALGLDGGIELDGAMEALLADADALAEQTMESTAAARWRAAGDAAFFGFGSLSQVLNSETSFATRNVCGNGVLLKSLN